jgi:hypothetical protein
VGQRLGRGRGEGLGGEAQVRADRGVVGGAPDPRRRQGPGGPHPPAPQSTVRRYQSVLSMRLFK